MAENVLVVERWPFLVPQIKLLNKYERWRRVGKILGISKAALQRLEWIIYYLEHERNASFTARHFGVARKTFYKWYREFDEDNLYSLYRLEDKSCPQASSESARLPLKKNPGPLPSGRSTTTATAR